MLYTEPPLQRLGFLGARSMAAENATSFPFTALSVVALFVSTALLGQQAFELWRPTETQARKQVDLPDPPVEARLWEDPLAAAARFREVARESCARAAEGRRSAAKHCERSYRIGVPEMRHRLEEQQLGGRLTVMAVLIQGDALVGADEARRRTRHAVLAGLNAQGFIPDDSDRMGLLRARLCDGLHACRDETVWARMKRAVKTPEESDIVYETLHTHASRNAQRRVMLLWIDDSKYRTRWLSALTVLLGELSPVSARLRIIGPVSSDSLSKSVRKDAAEWLDVVNAAAARSDGSLQNVARNLRVLDRLQIVSPFASAPLRLSDLEEETLKLWGLDSKTREGWKDGEREKCETECADFAFTRAFDVAARRLDEIERKQPAAARDAVVRKSPAPMLVRTIAPDTALASHLVKELRNRGLDICEQGRLVLIAEWDSIYARRFGEELTDSIWKDQDESKNKRRQECNPDKRLTTAVYSYSRGLDGATPERSAEQARVGVKPSGDDKDKKKRPVEWPEGQAQEDYVRRLVQLIRQDDRRSPVRAVGMIGADVHDKLLLAQALRETFPDRTLFTTDVDARLLHPTTTRYTRNMIVASSLPLDPEKLSAVLACLNGPEGKTVQHGALKYAVNRIGPFRDSYQTSTYIAARYVAIPGEPEDRRECLAKAIHQPALFELGRRDMVELGREVDSWSNAEGQQSSPEFGKRKIAAAAAFAALLLLALLVLVGVPGPAMATAWRYWSGKPDDLRDHATVEWPKVIVAMLEWAAFGFAIGVVLELGWPASSGTFRPMILAAAFAAFVPAFLYPGTPWIKRPAEANGPASWGYSLDVPIALFQLAVLAIFTFLAWRLVSAKAEVQEPFALLSGTSAWPSLLLPVLMIVLLMWFLDFAWFASANSGRRLERKFFGSAVSVEEVSTVKTPPAPGKLDRIRLWLRHATVWLRTKDVQPVDDRIDGKGPWHNAMMCVGTGLAGSCLWLRDATVWFWTPKDVQPADDWIDGERLWHGYNEMMRTATRLGRVLLWILVTAAIFTFLIFSTSYFSDSPISPEIPARGDTMRTLIFLSQVVVGIGLLVLLILVGDETILTWRFVSFLKKGRTMYPDATVKRFATELGTDLASKAATTIEALPYQRRPLVKPDQPVEAKNSLLDDWIDARLLADQTEAVGPLIMYPFILVGLVIVARSPIFDNWDMGPGVLMVLGLYLVWAIAMAVLLNKGAEQARQKALRNMALDLIWLEGTPSEAKDAVDGSAKEGRDAPAPLKDLVPSFKELIERVKGLRRGAFAPFFERPWVQALLVPLGGAGGIQLLEFLLYARTQ